MEALSFAHCSLDDEKAVALADLCRLTKLKTMDLAWNRSISADGWRQLLSALPVAMEDLCFSGCSLDDAKVAALACASRQLESHMICALCTNLYEVA